MTIRELFDKYRLNPATLNEIDVEVLLCSKSAEAFLNDCKTVYRVAFRDMRKDLGSNENWTIPNVCQACGFKILQKLRELSKLY